MTTARYNQPCQSSVRYWMMQPCVVAGSSNAEKPTHYLMLNSSRCASMNLYARLALLGALPTDMTVTSSHELKS